MKKLLLALWLLCGNIGAFAQFSISDSYYINRAKKQLEAEEAKKETKVIVVGTYDGQLCYVIRDGKRQGFIPQTEPKTETCRGWWLNSQDVMVPLRVDEPLPEKLPPPDQNDFAVLLEKLIRQKWTLVSVSGNADSAVYVFAKKEKKK